MRSFSRKNWAEIVFGMYGELPRFAWPRLGFLHEREWHSSYLYTDMQLQAEKS